MEIKEINYVQLSPELLNYFVLSKDSEYKSIPSIIENIKKIYRVSSLDIVSQIIYIHKVK